MSAASFLADFTDRKRQVRHYLSAVRIAEITVKMGTATRAQEGRLLTLRAGTFLVLYNLVEATTRGAVDAIHDRITSKRVPFGSLSLSLRKEVVKRFKKGADPTTDHTMNDFPSEFVAVAFDQGIQLAGNVDARFIRELGECYGFSCDTSKERTRGGSDLRTVKQHRNDLAHGVKTFEQIGRDYALRDLLSISIRSVRYMSEILTNIETYLEGERYLDIPTT